MKIRNMVRGGAIVVVSLGLASVGTGMGLTVSHKGEESRPALGSWTLHGAASAAVRPEDVDANEGGLRAPTYSLLASAAMPRGIDALMGSSPTVTAPATSLPAVSTGMIVSGSVARPETAYGCDAESASVGVTCINIEGSGNYVKYIAASILVEEDFVGYQHIYGPGGVNKYSGIFYYPAGEQGIYTWAPNGDVVPGKYCAQTFEENGDSLGIACENVD
ncbi:MAG: hypothetical protein ACYCWN_13735 [Ferrimicrobium sp.]|uniref:Secreted protein n=3 Tax=Ferrimicrobium acidiphilum TaxID=121039 RepID=A0ABV3Y1A7_9ACTN|nr:MULTISPECIES: hypothetical protein [Ferrimicrobium]